MKVLHIVLALVLALGLSFCGDASSGGDTPAASGGGGGDAAKYDKMKTLKLFKTACTICHKMREADKYDAKQWKFHITRMIPNSNMQLDVTLSDKAKAKLIGIHKKAKKYGDYARKWNKKQLDGGKVWPVQ